MAHYCYDQNSPTGCCHEEQKLEPAFQDITELVIDHGAIGLPKPSTNRWRTVSDVQARLGYLLVCLDGWVFMVLGRKKGYSMLQPTQPKSQRIFPAEDRDPSERISEFMNDPATKRRLLQQIILTVERDKLPDKLFDAGEHASRVVAGKNPLHVAKRCSFVQKMMGLGGFVAKQLRNLTDMLMDTLSDLKAVNEIFYCDYYIEWLVAA